VECEVAAVAMHGDTDGERRSGSCTRRWPLRRSRESLRNQARDPRPEHTLLEIRRSGKNRRHGPIESLGLDPGFVCGDGRIVKIKTAKIRNNPEFALKVVFFLKYIGELRIFILREKI
jgi:hypothetical protein